MSFDEIADQRGLSSARTHLGELQWDVEADANLRRKFGSDIDFDGIMYLMCRRFLDPALVAYLFDRLPDRPLERALVAWDVARGSLLGKDDAALAQRLATELAPLKALGPPANNAVPRDRIPALIEAIRVSSDTSRVSADFATMPSLAGVLALGANDNAEHIAALNAHAKKLAYAHLPALALAFLQLAWERFAPRSSLELMLDIALDHDMVGGLPQLTGTDDDSVRLAAYLAIRACSYEYDVVTGAQILEKLDELPAIHGSNEPRLVLARAELTILQAERVDDASKAIIESVARSRSRLAVDGWRYAEFVHRVLDVYNPDVSVDSPLGHFTWKYGNNARVWGHADHRKDARAEVLKTLARELRFASHDPEVWRAASILLPDGGDIDVQLGERLMAQLLAAYA
ncbi:MAG: hypothetical protein H0T46_05075 [Deltaproteobacteria bacterium]|nr:hypothetical protein [Deltaproteobacteria bacterium]